MEERTTFTCPVCGWDRLDEDPREQRQEICPCCSTQFGCHDCGPDREAIYLRLRGYWLADGAKWWSRWRPAPEGWDAAAQLAALEAVEAMERGDGEGDADEDEDECDDEDLDED